MGEYISTPDKDGRIKLLIFYFVNVCILFLKCVLSQPCTYMTVLGSSIWVIFFFFTASCFLHLSDKCLFIQVASVLVSGEGKLLRYPERQTHRLISTLWLPERFIAHLMILCPETRNLLNSGIL